MRPVFGSLVFISALGSCAVVRILLGDAARSREVSVMRVVPARLAMSRCSSRRALTGASTAASIRVMTWSGALLVLGGFHASRSAATASISTS